MFSGVDEAQSFNFVPLAQHEIGQATVTAPSNVKGAEGSMPIARDVAFGARSDPMATANNIVETFKQAAAGNIANYERSTTSPAGKQRLSRSTNITDLIQRPFHIPVSLLQQVE